MPGVRVIILSNDINFKSFLSVELRKDTDFEVKSDCANILSVPAAISRTIPNVMVLDLNVFSTSEAYLKSLLEKYNLSIIAVGNVLGINLKKSGIDILIQRPDSSQFARNVFIRNISGRIKTFCRKSTANVNDLRDTVDAYTKIVAIASSTGGTEALVEVLTPLPPKMPPILIVQHMPSMFTKQYAERLDKLCGIKVKEAEDGEYIKTGTAYVAPGDLHMKLVKKNSRLSVDCFMADKVHGVRPAADILFNSITPILGGNMVGVILTGMGSDGARGLYELHMKGAKVIGQNQESCVVYGMPKAAFDLGAVDYQLPLSKISSKIMELV